MPQRTHFKCSYFYLDVTLNKLQLFTRVTLLWCLKSEDKIELSWPEYIDVRCWQSSGWIWLEIFKLSLRLIHVGTVYLIYMYVDCRYSKYDYLLWWNSKNRKQWNEPKEFSQLQEGDQSSWIENWKECKILLQPLKMDPNDKSEKTHGLAMPDYWFVLKRTFN